MGKSHAHDELISAAARVFALTLAAAFLLSPAYASQVIVVRRGWHIDVGFAVQDLQPTLRAISSELPNARFVLFGFGDMHYLLSKNHGSSSLAAALWPGRGIMLVTGLQGTPQQGFGAAHVIELDVSEEQAAGLQQWIRASFAATAAGLSPFQEGPYDDSLYYLATQPYSALHTCNTWAAQALRAGRLAVRSKRVLFAGQLWSQIRKLSQLPNQTQTLAPM